ncbi:transposase [Gemmata sp. JC717]|uniref:transposase n=1 Tax=Gemmata algarum TaxID=2975278 RepID=UPI0021BB742F|nr:transposase [Gemmata algarum]MDY3555212.1 transposase [Gemmata algarum]
MLLGAVFDRFVEESPLSVMSRATIEHALSASALDALFEHTAETGYTQELLFSTMVKLMSRVVCEKAHHVQSSYPHMVDRIPVTLKSVYEKLQNIELGVSAGLVRHVADRCHERIGRLGGERNPERPGRAVRILDGNHLGATPKRLRVARGRTAGPLPGLALAVRDPDRMLITDIIPCEDGHTQERALLDPVMPLVQPAQVWVGDRNVCTAEFRSRIDQRGASFVIRRHGNTTLEGDGEWTAEVRADTGRASERPIWVCVGGEPVLPVRCVRVRLDQPTEDGDRELEILTNVPGDQADAATVATVYRGRWAVEGAFHELAVARRCEVNTLGYPKAAVFGFAVAVAAYNVLAVLKAAMRTAHGWTWCRTKCPVTTWPSNWPPFTRA